MATFNDENKSECWDDFEVYATKIGKKVYLEMYNEDDVSFTLELSKEEAKALFEQLKAELDKE